MENHEKVAVGIALVIVLLLFPLSLLILVELGAFYVLWKHQKKKENSTEAEEWNKWAEGEIERLWGAFRVILREVKLSDIHNKEDYKLMRQLKEEWDLEEGD